MRTAVLRPAHGLDDADRADRTETVVRTPRTEPTEGPSRDRTQPVATGRPTGARAPMLLVLSFAVAAPVSILFAALGEAHAQVFMLVVLCLGACAVGCTARPADSLVVGPVFWLFLDGFVVNRRGDLDWDGHLDAIRLGALVGAGLLGSLLAVVARRATEETGPDGERH